MELYWDDTGISTKKKCGPIWLGISNCDQSVKRSPESRMLLAVMPADTDIGVVLHEIVTQISALTNVEFFYATEGSMCRFQCSLALLLGDSPASNHLIGKVQIVFIVLTGPRLARSHMHPTL